MQVRVGAHEYSEVFAFTHQDKDIVSSFVQITASNNAVLTLTADHYLYVNGGLRPAGYVVVGDTLLAADGSPHTVVEIIDASGIGLFNPHTLNGDIIVVSNVSFSCKT